MAMSFIKWPAVLESHLIDQLEEKLTEGTYGSVKFSASTNRRLHDFGTQHKIPGLLDRDEYHTTIIYSRKPIAFKPLGKMQLVSVDHSTFAWDLFGEEKNTLVLKFQSKFLTQRWQKAMDMGAMYDFDTYKPHVSLSYDASGFDISKLPLPEWNLYISEEKTEQLDG